MKETTSPAVIELLKAVLGPEGVSSDEAQLQAHAGDWSEAPKTEPELVLFPRNSAQVAKVLQILNEQRVQVVVQGGMTGLAGGATPRAGEVALSLAKMTEIEEVDEVGGTAVVQAGVTLEALQTHLGTSGWSFPLDLGARGSCQLGGNAATNAGGNRVIRFGTMRELVLGLEVALPNGMVLDMMHRTTKNTTGIDLKHLFIGSEGMLGVITRLVLQLVPASPDSHVALCALPDFDSAARLLKRLRAGLPALSAFELMWAGYMNAATNVSSLPQPFAAQHPMYALMEVLGDDGEHLERLLMTAMEQGDVADAIVAQSTAEAQRLWKYREAVAELLSRMQPHAAFDVGIPMNVMDAFVAEMQSELCHSFPGQQHLFFGHLGDGNLHLLSGPFDSPADLLAAERRVYEAVGRVGGAISAEHGIGTVKKEFIGLSRSANELVLMKALKQLFDPHGVLNGGRVLADDTRNCGEGHLPAARHAP